VRVRINEPWHKKFAIQVDAIWALILIEERCCSSGNHKPVVDDNGVVNGKLFVDG
jgi:hypothetical protein